MLTFAQTIGFSTPASFKAFKSFGRFMQQVTIGMIGDGEVPTIGNGVYIGAGAKIIGKVSVGDGARIGANAVVTKDVPSGYTAVGVPARLVSPENQRTAKVELARQEGRV